MSHGLVKGSFNMIDFKSIMGYMFEIIVLMSKFLPRQSQSVLNGNNIHIHVNYS